MGGASRLRAATVWGRNVFIRPFVTHSAYLFAQFRHPATWLYFVPSHLSVIPFSLPSFSRVLASLAVILFSCLCLSVSDHLWQKFTCEAQNISTKLWTYKRAAAIVYKAIEACDEARKRGDGGTGRVREVSLAHPAKTGAMMIVFMIILNLLNWEGSLFVIFESELEYRGYHLFTISALELRNRIGISLRYCLASELTPQTGISLRDSLSFWAETPIWNAVY